MSHFSGLYDENTDAQVKNDKSYPQQQEASPINIVLALPTTDVYVPNTDQLRTLSDQRQEYEMFYGHFKNSSQTQKQILC